jgi:hypothetical protein
MDLALRVLLVGLAAWRVSALLSYEDGPFGVFVRFRALFAPGPNFATTDEPNGWRATLRSECYQVLSCVWCLSPWAAAAAWGVWELSPAVVAVGAAAAIIVLVERAAR